jgi:ribosomal protein S18 acetylase RimI-like enzyme
MGATANGRPAFDAHSPAPVPIRAGTTDDAAAAARLHVAGIREGFLSSLGSRFLAHLYARIARDPGCFLLVAVDPQTGPRGVAGFIAGSDDVGRLYRAFVRHDGVRAALSAFGRLLSSLPRVLQTLRHGKKGGGTGRGTELLAVAVDASRHGHGIGRALVEAFLGEVVARGGKSAHVVVGAHNIRAIELYRQAGFVEAARFEMHPGTSSLLLQWDRPAGQDSP